MSNNDWGQDGTPRAATWDNDTDDYGIPLGGWDDYSDEQSAPVPAPQPQVAPAVAAETVAVPAESSTESAVETDTTELAEPVAESFEKRPVRAAAEAEADDVEPQHGGDDTSFGAPAEETPAEALTSEAAPAAEPYVGEPETTPAATFAEPEDASATHAAEAAETVVAAEKVEEDIAVAPAEVAAPAESLEVEETLTDNVASPVSDVDHEVQQPEANDESLEATTVNNESFGFTAASSNDQAAGEERESTTAEADNADVSPEFESTAETVTSSTVEATVASEDEEDTVDVSGFGRPLNAPVVADASQAAAAAAGAGVGLAAINGVYRVTDDDTQVIETDPKLAAELAEEERLAQQVRAEKEARDQRLGLVATSEANAVREAVPAPRRGVGAFGSFGLFILRLVVAGIVGVVGYQVLSNVDATTEFLSRTIIPEPRLVSWIIGFTLFAIALMLVIGLAVRLAGLALTVVAVGSLALIRWGAFSPFVEGMEGFTGDKDLLLAAIGVMLFTLGGGRAGIDGAIAKARAEAKEAKQR